MKVLLIAWWFVWGFGWQTHVVGPFASQEACQRIVEPFSKAQNNYAGAGKGHARPVCISDQ